MRPWHYLYDKLVLVLSDSDMNMESRADEPNSYWCEIAIKCYLRLTSAWKSEALSRDSSRGWGKPVKVKYPEVGRLRCDVKIHPNARSWLPRIPGECIGAIQLFQSIIPSTRLGKCSPCSSRLYHLGVWQAQKAKESGDVRPRLPSWYCMPPTFLFPFFHQALSSQTVWLSPTSRH